MFGGMAGVICFSGRCEDEFHCAEDAEGIEGRANVEKMRYIIEPMGKWYREDWCGAGMKCESGRCGDNSTTYYTESIRLVEICIFEYDVCVDL